MPGIASLNMVPFAREVQKHGKLRNFMAGAPGELSVFRGHTLLVLQINGAQPVMSRSQRCSLANHI